MPIITAQVTIPHENAIPRDAVVNTFHFTTPVGATQLEIDAAYGNIATRLAAFYNSVHSPGVASIGSYLASTLNPPLSNLKMYDRSDAIPRAPRYNAPIPITSTGTSALPAEIAVCLSYQAAKVSGSNQVNRRGRMFFGPFTSATNDAGGSGVSRPTAALRNALAGAASTLAANAGGQAFWAIFSRTLNSAQTVTDGWVDDAWDVQRRRGERASTRTLWT